MCGRGCNKPVAYWRGLGLSHKSAYHLSTMPACPDDPPVYDHSFTRQCLRLDRYQQENLQHLLTTIKQRAKAPPSGVDEEWAFHVHLAADKLLNLLDK